MELFSKLFLLDILIHVTFLYIILYFFYFLVAIKEERNSIENELESNMNKFINSNEKIKEYIKKFNSLPGRDEEIEIIKKYLRKINSFQETGNKKFKRIALLILIILVSITLISIIFFYKYYKISGKILLKIITDNILLFAVIGMIEMLFFFFVILKYIPIKSSEFKEMFIEIFNEEIIKKKN